MISGPLRFALHQALDLVLDAIDAERAGAGAIAPKKRRTRTVREPPVPNIVLTDEERERARRGWEKDGWKETAGS